MLTKAPDFDRTNDIDVCVPLRAFILEEDLMKHFTCFEMSDYTQAVLRLYSKGAHIERFSSHWFWFSSPVYIDVYHLFPCAHYASPVNCTGATSPHEGVYLVGSCHEKVNRNMREKDIFPINWTGSTINGMHFPTPNNPEAILLHEYGPAWLLLIESYMFACLYDHWTRGSGGVSARRRRMPFELPPLDGRKKIV